MTSLNKKFMLGMGKEVAVQDLDLVIRFISVVKDSRCPKGVKCIWEGDAEILLEVRKGRGEATSVTLHTSQRFNQEGMHGQYKIRIIALMPYPQKDMEIKPESYILTLLAEKD